MPPRLLLEQPDECSCRPVGRRAVGNMLGLRSLLDMQDVREAAGRKSRAQGRCRLEIPI